MRYGDAVQVEYVDVADPENQTQFPDLVAVVADRDLPYPLVAINGQLRAAGSAHFYHILPYVEASLEPQELEQEA